MVSISQKLMDQIYQHGEDTYPEECCGVLVASQSDPERIVDIRPMKNVNSGSKNTRYNIDPMDLMALEDELDSTDLLMTGIYHSHPDHPAKPSQYDRNHAWPNLSYFVMRTTNGVTEEITSWVLDTTQNEFTSEDINIIEE